MELESSSSTTSSTTFQGGGLSPIIGCGYPHIWGGMPPDGIDRVPIGGGIGRIGTVAGSTRLLWPLFLLRRALPRELLL
jgi:hypothetical protein